MASRRDKTLKVCLKRTGGVAGIRGQWEIDGHALDSKKASELKKLLETADFFSLPCEVGNLKEVRDVFCYELTVEDEDKKHTVRCAEPAVPKPVRDCLDWILKTTRREA